MFLLPTWFLTLNGVCLLILSGLMLLRRLQESGSWSRKFLGMVWACLCLSMGVTLVLMGWGVVRQPAAWLGRSHQAEPVFPTDR